MLEKSLATTLVILRITEETKYTIGKVLIAACLRLGQVAIEYAHINQLDRSKVWIVLLRKHLNWLADRELEVRVLLWAQQISIGITSKFF